MQQVFRVKSILDKLELVMGINQSLKHRMDNIQITTNKADAMMPDLSSL
jgi:hypothetical protein